MILFGFDAGSSETAPPHTGQRIQVERRVRLMTMFFKRVKTDGIAQVSYVVGDDASQTAAVLDPRPNVEIYLQIARRFGVAITHVFETHIHADFMSGARALTHQLGGAKLCASAEGDAQYGFDVEAVRDGDVFQFGSVRLIARHTPGHTPEHMSYLITESSDGDQPWGMFTGDSLMVGSAGRPDLLGDEQTDELMEQLFHTLREVYLRLPDGVVIFPCHVAGSACGADIGDRPMSTIGYERRTNRFLQYQDLEEFRRFVRESAPPEPHHYRRLKKLNADGPPILECPPPIRGLPADRFQSVLTRGGAQLVDTRQMLAFGGGHIDGAINIGDRPELSVWAGQMLKPEEPLLLVAEQDSDLTRLIWHFAYAGFVNFAGYLAGGMKAWEDAGLPLRRLRQLSVQELREHMHRTQLIDVRAPEEWRKGHIPGASHLHVADLREESEQTARFRKDAPVTVYCDTGYRASIAASILQARGFEDVRNVPGSWQAWKNAGYKVEK